MKCPSCNYDLGAASLTCSACGQAYDQAALEALHHLEYLLAWLQKRATMLPGQAFEQLRGEALSQLDAVHGTLGLALPAEIGSELALVEASLRQLQSWIKATGLDLDAETALHRYLSNQADTLRKRLAGRRLEVEAPRDLEVLDFALRSLPLWARQPPLRSTDIAALHSHLTRQRTALLKSIAHKLALAEATLHHLQGWVVATRIRHPSAVTLRRFLSAWVDNLKGALADQPVEVEPVRDLQVLDFAVESLPLWARRSRLRSGDVKRLHRYLEASRTALLQPAPTPAAPEVPVAALAPEPTPPVTPPAAPRPAGPAAPAFSWARLWERAWSFVVSGALLRGLLYLGAFMIVVSAAVLVVLFWDRFPELMQLGLIAAVPTTFYLAGWGVRARLKLPQAGGVLAGIGALLVAVDFAAVFQFGGLADRVDGDAYWVGASVFCTIVYAVTAWRLPGEFFQYITLIGGTSTVLAVTRLFDLPLEWSIASVPASATAMAANAGWLKRASGKWRTLARPVRYLPQLLTPASLAAILFVPGKPALGQLAAFACAALSYGLFAWHSPKAIFAHAAVWSSVGAVYFALRAVPLPAEWYAATIAALACPYILGGRWLGGRLDETFAPRRGYLSAVYVVGFGLVATATLGGFVTLIFDLWAGVIALTLTALVLAGCAYVFRRPILVLLAGGLFIVPFSLAIVRWLLDGLVPQWTAWLMAAWGGLALAYMGLAVLLRTAEKYAASLNLWAHLLAPFACLGLLVNYAHDVGDWFAGPTLAALGGVILVYLTSAVIHHGGRHPALSNYVTWLPGRIRRAVFLWPIGLLIPVWLAVAWSESELGQPWLGAAFAGLALVYVGLGQLMARRTSEYRLPPHAYAYPLAVIAILIAFAERWALLTTLYIVVGVLAVLAFVYRRVLETTLAALLFLWPFQLSLELSPLTRHTHSLAYALVAALGYLPLGMVLDKAGRRYAMPARVVEYALSACAVIASLLGRFGAYRLDLRWVGVAVPLIITGLQVLNLYRLKRSAFAWVAALTFAIGFWQALTLLHVPPEYNAVAWVGLAFVYLLAERTLLRAREGVWFRAFRWPLGAGAAALCALGVLLTAGGTVAAFTGEHVENYVPLIIAQVQAVVLIVLAARLHQSRWLLYLEPWLAFFPVTLFFICCGEPILGQTLTASQYGIVWSGLALVHLLAAVMLDRFEVRYAHGPYLGGYILIISAVLWTLADGSALLWTLGLGILSAVGSAVLAHTNRHRTWDELIAVFFGRRQNTVRSAVRGGFLWLAAWLFPVWCVLLLRQLDVGTGFQWLGFGLPALLLLGLAAWLRRADPVYAWPFHTAAQFYTALGLVITTPLTVRFLAGEHRLPSEELSALALVLLQTLAVVLYAASAWVLRRRTFGHVAAWLSLFPYTVAWIVYGPGLTQAQFAWAWIGWAAVLLAVGVALDRAKVRYAHGPYLAGYILAGFTLIWSAPEHLTSLYTLAAAIGLAVASHALVHYGRHRSFDDFIRFVWRKPGTVAQRAARTAFLFFAAYAFPVFLVRLLTYHSVPPAWRGLALALTAPIYIALGLGVRGVKSEYTWPLYSAGYALTAIGTMVTFDDLALAIYVLGLDAVVYAASAYIFRQSFWLYLTSTLVPVIALLTFHYNRVLSAPWLGGTFMGLAFLYFGIGLWFDRRRVGQDAAASPSRQAVSPFALPFYAPGYLLSAVALAVASGEKFLALEVYTAGVMLYALSAWVFRESLFLYPAAWLAAVPYYLGMTLTQLEPRWYGLGWLPLVAAYIAVGRFAFQKRPLEIRSLRTFSAALLHPAMPFYLLAYGLSVSMIALSRHDPLTITVALGTGAAVYFGSAALFRRPAWLYPGLLAAHLTLLSYFTISPSARPVHYITLPFLGMTWAMALIGYGFSRREAAVSGRSARWPFLSHLLPPSWAQPFLIFAAVDLVLWQMVALIGPETATILATGNALLLGLFAMLWQDTALAYGTLPFFMLAVGYRLHLAALSLAGAFAWVGGIGFGLYLLARIAEQIVSRTEPRLSRLGVWPKPLTRTAVFLTSVAVIATVPMVVTHPTAVGAALAFAGALYLAIAYRGRYHRLGYLGMALLELAWVLALIVQDVQQPQWYAIPAGLYFTGVGYLERRRGRGLFAVMVESLGLAVLLVTSFIQSLNGAQGFPYFVLLLVEGLIVIWWGASRRVKVPFFVGLGASALNVVAQVVVLINVYEVNRWFIILGVGLLLVTAAVFVERQRKRIVARAQEWREALERWE